MTDTQAHANQLVAQINGGASFASVATASSLDTQTKAQGGCPRVQLHALAGGTGPQRAVGHRGPALGPGPGPDVGPVAHLRRHQPAGGAADGGASLVRRELLQTTANVNRVSKEIVAFARTADVTVNPQYGTWKRLAVVPPVGPPPKYLLAGGGRIHHRR